MSDGHPSGNGARLRLARQQHRARNTRRSCHQRDDISRRQGNDRRPASPHHKSHANQLVTHFPGDGRLIALRKCQAPSRE